MYITVYNSPESIISATPREYIAKHALTSDTLPKLFPIIFDELSVLKLFQLTNGVFIYFVACQLLQSVLPQNSEVSEGCSQLGYATLMKIYMLARRAGAMVYHGGEEKEYAKK